MEQSMQELAEIASSTWLAGDIRTKDAEKGKSYKRVAVAVSWNKSDDCEKERTGAIEKLHKTLESKIHEQGNPAVIAGSLNVLHCSLDDSDKCEIYGWLELDIPIDRPDLEIENGE